MEYESRAVSPARLMATEITNPVRLQRAFVTRSACECAHLAVSRIYWRRLLGFLGPGFLISVGYMDPGNWATDIAGGSRFGYTLLFVIMLSNLMAILLQSLALKLGVATERDLAQLCHESYGKQASILLMDRSGDRDCGVRSWPR